jgi:hypothetical protein
MSEQVKIRVTNNGPYLTDVMMFPSKALRDTTVGKVYEAVLYDQGEIDSEGDRCDYPGVLFKDDTGESVYSFVGGGWEVVDV